MFPAVCVQTRRVAGVSALRIGVTRGDTRGHHSFAPGPAAASQTHACSERDAEKQPLPVPERQRQLH